MKRQKNPEYEKILKISEAEYFLAFNEYFWGQALLSQCDETLIRSCFSKVASGPSF